MKFAAKGAVAISVLFLWTRLVFGTGDDLGPATLSHAGMDVRVLQGARLPETPELSLPTSVRTAGETLVLLDRYADNAILVLDRADGSPLRSAGPKGEGPEELTAAWSVDVIHEPQDAIRVMDLALLRFSVFSLADLSLLSVDKIDGLGRITDHVELPDGRIAVIGSLNLARIAFLDAHGVVVGHGGQLPPAEGNIPTPVLLHAYQGFMEPNPQRTLLSIVTRHAGWLEIYTAEGSLLRRVSGPFEFDPLYTVAEGVKGPAMVPERGLRYGYLDSATTDSRIFALFSGRLNGVSESDAVYGRHVHVFDWAGNLVEVLELSGDTFAIAVDEAGSQMYAIEHFPEPRILVYDLTG